MFNYLNGPPYTDVSFTFMTSCQISIIIRRIYPIGYSPRFINFSTFHFFVKIPTLFLIERITVEYVTITGHSRISLRYKCTENYSPQQGFLRQNTYRKSGFISLQRCLKRLTSPYMVFLHLHGESRTLYTKAQPRIVRYNKLMTFDTPAE